MYRVALVILVLCAGCNKSGSGSAKHEPSLTPAQAADKAADDVLAVIRAYAPMEAYTGRARNLWHKCAARPSSLEKFLPCMNAASRKANAGWQQLPFARVATSGCARAVEDQYRRYIKAQRDFLRAVVAFLKRSGKPLSRHLPGKRLSQALTACGKQCAGWPDLPRPFKLSSSFIDCTPEIFDCGKEGPCNLEKVRSAVLLGCPTLKVKATGHVKVQSAGPCLDHR